MADFYYEQGNIFEFEGIVVIPINTSGEIHGEVLTQAASIFPDAVQDFQIRGQQAKINLGEPYVVFDRVAQEQVIMFPTKPHWRSSSRTGYIVRGLRAMPAVTQEITSELPILFPKLGCGTGGLSWDQVDKLFIRGAAAMAREFIIIL